MIKCSIPPGAVLFSLSYIYKHTYNPIKLSDHVKTITKHGQEHTVDGKLNGKSLPPA